jgi:hypothetical protein
VPIESLAAEDAKLRDADRALAKAMRELPFLSAATPRAGLTRAELVKAFEAGAPREPDWRYQPLDPARADDAVRSLEGLAAELEASGAGALGGLYAARARELASEARIAAAVGGPGLVAAARARFVPEGADSEASTLARAWVADPAPAPAADTTTDGNDPGSLASRLREEIGKRRLPFRVVVADGLAPLAATGDHTVWVAAGRALGREDVERTVVHELLGHVVPRATAASLSARIFAIGTARGTDDQEGLALVYEERHGFLRGARRRELALRHRAIEAMDGGATLIDVVRTLVTRDGAPTSVAVAAAERAFRGSAGRTPGLGRERVYLSAYARVKAHLSARPADEAVLASGQVALDAIEILRQFQTR